MSSLISSEQKTSVVDSASYSAPPSGTVTGEGALPNRSSSQVSATNLSSSGMSAMPNIAREPTQSLADFNDFLNGSSSASSLPQQHHEQSFYGSSSAMHPHAQLNHSGNNSTIYSPSTDVASAFSQSSRSGHAMPRPGTAPPSMIDPILGEKRSSSAAGFADHDSTFGEMGAFDDDDEETAIDGTKKGPSGRRKIKIEYIEDKSRRHITFSKRKAGIMKKVGV
jgi:hypothetical protein